MLLSITQLPRLGVSERRKHAELPRVSSRNPGDRSQHSYATEHSRLPIDQFGSASDLDGADNTMWILTSATNDLRAHELALGSLEAVLEQTNQDERERYVLVANLTRLVAMSTWPEATERSGSTTS